MAPDVSRNVRPSIFSYNLLQRSFTLCNSYLKINSEFQSTKTTLMRNEYPSRFIDKCIRQFLNKKFSQLPKTQTQTCNHFTFKLPYLGNISHNIEKELQQFIKKQLPDSKLRFIHTTTKLKHYFYTKDPQSHLRRSNVVYRLNCSCESFYIGRTRKNLMKRLQEHQASDTSEVCNHIQCNTDHKVDFNNPQILTHSPDEYKLLILESLFIQQLKPDLNLDFTSFPLHLFNSWPTSTSPGSVSVSLFFASWLKTQHNVSFLALTIAPGVSRNVRPSIFSCILAILFVITLLTNSQLYRLPKFVKWFDISELRIAYKTICQIGKQFVKWFDISELRIAYKTICQIGKQFVKWFDTSELRIAYKTICPIGKQFVKWFDISKLTIAYKTICPIGKPFVNWFVKSVTKLSLKQEIFAWHTWRAVLLLCR